MAIIRGDKNIIATNSTAKSYQRTQTEQRSPKKVQRLKFLGTLPQQMTSSLKKQKLKSLEVTGG